MRRAVLSLFAACLLLAGCSGIARIQPVSTAVVTPPQSQSGPGTARPVVAPKPPATQPAEKTTSTATTTVTGTETQGEAHGTQTGTVLTVSRPTGTGTANTVKPGKPASTPAKETPAPAPKPTPSEPRLAILVYHDIDERANNAYTITPELFEAQVKMLVEEGYAFYHLSDVERLLAGGKGMPEKAVLLAFDDGYSSFYTHVMPIARKYGVPATCFVVTKYMDEVVVGSLPHMSGAQIRALAASPLADLALHTHDGHHEGITADGSSKPVLVNRVQKADGVLETAQEYQTRVVNDFRLSVAALNQYGATRYTKHFTFPYTARSEEAVRLGQQAGIKYFYVGGEKLVTPDSDPTAIPRVHAGGPDITAAALRTKLRRLFSQP